MERKKWEQKSGYSEYSKTETEKKKWEVRVGIIIIRRKEIGRKERGEGLGVFWSKCSQRELGSPTNYILFH